jgi:hypothetical protein
MFSAASPVGAAMHTTFPRASSRARISRRSTDFPVPPTPVTNTFSPFSTAFSASFCSLLNATVFSGAIWDRDKARTRSSTSAAPAPTIGGLVMSKSAQGEARGSIPARLRADVALATRRVRARRCAKIAFCWHAHASASWHFCCRLEEENSLSLVARR